MRKIIEIEKEIAGVRQRIAEITPKQIEAEQDMQRIETDFASGTATVEDYQHAAAAKQLHDLTIKSLTARAESLQAELDEVNEATRRKSLTGRLKQILTGFAQDKARYFDTRQALSDAAAKAVEANAKLAEDQRAFLETVREILPEVSSLGHSPVPGVKNYRKLDELFADIGADTNPDLLRELRTLAIQAPLVEFSRTADHAIHESLIKASEEHYDARMARERGKAARRARIESEAATVAAGSENYLAFGTTMMLREKKDH